MPKEILGEIVEYNFPVIRKVHVRNFTSGATFIVSAIVDTGAHGYYLKPDIIEAIGLAKVGEVDQMHPIEGLSKKTPFYGADIEIQDVLFSNRVIQVLYHEKYPVQLILGTHLLENSIFTYNWHDKSFRIEFQ